MTHEPSMSEKKDFFISYTEKDKDWAEWIAWHLEQASYTTVFQAWDIRPGNNFVVMMDNAAKSANRTIVVLSPHFFESDFTPPEWAAAFAADPKGDKRLVLPVLVEPADIAGLLGQIVYIDLTQVEGEAAVRELLAGVQPGRNKPNAAPDFPGRRLPNSVSTPQPATTSVDWQPLSEPLDVTWRSDIRSAWESSHSTTVEVALLPVGGQLITVTKLGGLNDSLADAGRRSGLFSATQELAASSTAEHVSLAVTRTRGSNDAGFLFTRRGQRAGWIELPNDTLGSVFDPKELVPRLAALIQILASIEGLELAERYVVAARIGPLMMLTEADASVVGNRSSASMSLRSGAEYTLPQEDSVRSAALVSGAQEIASEIVARFQAGLRANR